MTKKNSGQNSPTNNDSTSEADHWQDELVELTDDLILSAEDDEFLERIWELLRREYERDPESFRRLWQEELAGQPPLELPLTWPDV